MIRIMAKHPDGKWLVSSNTDYTKDAEKMYAKILVRLYRDLMDNGFILSFTVEIQSSVENRNFIQVIGYGGM